jgi:hypothetical protein
MGRYSLDIQRGQQTEKCFVHLAERRGYNVTKTSSSVDIKDHIDFMLIKDDEKFGVDVKARKKVSKHISNGYDDENVWVEFHNVRGDPGWLYGKADKIAFEQFDKFILVDRESLKDYCETTVVPVFVDNSYDAVYKCKQRTNRKDVISRIPVADIIHPYSFTIDVEIWEKRADNGI